MAGPCSSEPGWGTDKQPEEFTATVGGWLPETKHKWIGWSAWEMDADGNPLGIQAGDIDYFSVRDFDLVGPDDSIRIKYAIEAALKSGVGAVFLPRRTYVVQSPIVVALTAGQSLRLFSEFATLQVDSAATFKWPSEAAVLTFSSDFRPLTVERLHLNGMNKAPTGIRLSGFNGSSATLRNVSAQFFTFEGIRVIESSSPSIWDCTADHNQGDGWSIIGCNGGSFIGCAATGNKGSGFSVSGSSGDWWGGSLLSHVVAEGNGASGICIWDGTSVPSDGHATGIRIRDGWVESNGKNGVRVAAWDVLVDGLKIVPGGDNYSKNRAVWVDESASGITVRDCVFSKETIGGAKYHEPHDAAGQARHVFFDHNYTTGSDDSVCSPDSTRVGLVVPKPG